MIKTVQDIKIGNTINQGNQVHNDTLTVIHVSHPIEEDTDLNFSTIYKFKVGICTSNSREWLIYSYSPDAKVVYLPDSTIIIQAQSDFILRAF